jgi:amino acid transporter
LVNLSLIQLRRKMPRMDRPFKAPLYPFTPLAGIVMSVLLLVFPVILRDVNAESALLSSLGMVAIVMVTYYLRMVKREIDFNRLRAAVGGICLGAGIALIVLTPSIATFSMFIPMVLVGIVSIIAGILNIVLSARKVD